MTRAELENQLKELIINTLNLEDFSPDDIDSKAPLFHDGLGLDSIDALELGLAVKKTFKINLKAENEEMRSHFYSVSTLADYIEAQLQTLAN